MRPMFLIRGLVDRGRARIVGEDHVKMELAHPQDPKLSFDAIGFKLGHHFEMIKTGKPFSVLCTLEENEWNGQVKMQLNVKDIKPVSYTHLRAHETVLELVCRLLIEKKKNNKTKKKNK